MPVAMVIFALPLLVAAEGEADKLAGVYTCVSAVRDGKPIPQQTVEQLKLTLTDTGYKTELGTQVLFDSTYRIDSAKSPKQIDMIATEGDNAGKAAEGIYTLEGDKLTLCHTMPGQPRPKTFESKPGSGITLVVWKKRM